MDPENPFAGQGAVLLDIGGDIGALVVDMPAALLGEEVDIVSVDSLGSPGHDHSHDHNHDSTTHHHSDGHEHGLGHRPHVAVVDRPVGAGSRPSLVFPELLEGSYVLMPKGTDDVVLRVDVRGGEVTSASWPR